MEATPPSSSLSATKKVRQPSSSKSARKKDIANFHEELKQCEVDTEFVWSLWKESQKGNPDMSTVVNMVTDREERKFLSERKDLLKKLKERERHIHEMRELNSHKQAEAEQVMTTRIARLEEALKDRDSIIAENSKKLGLLSSQKEALKERNMEIKMLKMEIGSSIDKSSELKQELVRNQSDLIDLRMKYAAREQELMRMRNELEYVRDHQENAVDMSGVQTANIKVLQTQNQKLKKELVSMKKKCKGSNKPSSSHVEQSTDPALGVTQQNVKLKDELSNMKLLLKARSEELKNLRLVHNRRLERMKALKTGHDLVLEQLKTYESKEQLSQRTSISGDDGVDLQHEHSDKVWNELAHYKSTCEMLKRKQFHLEEERDAAKTELFHAKTDIVKLKTITQATRLDIEGKLKAIAALESIEKPSSQNQIRDLVRALEETRHENKKLQEESRYFASQCTTLKSEVEHQKQLAAVANLEKKRPISAATMTSVHDQFVSIEQSEPTSMTSVHDHGISVAQSAIVSSAGSFSARQEKYLTPEVSSHCLMSTEELYSIPVTRPAAVVVTPCVKSPGFAVSRNDVISSQCRLSTNTISTPAAVMVDSSVGVTESGTTSASNSSEMPLTQPAIGSAAIMVDTRSVRVTGSGPSKPAAVMVDAFMQVNEQNFSSAANSPFLDRSSPAVMMVGASLKVKKSSLSEKPLTKHASMQTSMTKSASVQVDESFFSTQASCTQKSQSVLPTGKLANKKSSFPTEQATKITRGTQYAMDSALEANNVSPALPTHPNEFHIPTAIGTPNQHSIQKSPKFSSATSFQFDCSIKSSENTTSTSSDLISTQSLDKKSNIDNSKKFSAATSSKARKTHAASVNTEFPYCTATTSASLSARNYLVQTEGHFPNEMKVKSQTEVKSSSFITSPIVNSSSDLVSNIASTSQSTFSSAVPKVEATTTASSQKNGLASATTVSSQLVADSASSLELISLAAACSKPGELNGRGSSIETNSVLALKAHLGSTTELGKKVCEGKCSCQQQVRSLRMRLRMLRKQIVVLNTTKQVLTQHIDDENAWRTKSEADLKDMAKKLQLTKMKLEAVKSENTVLSQELVNLKALQANLTLQRKSEADLKRLECQNKDLLAKCASLSSSFKSSETSLETKSSLLSEALDKCSKQERDLKQKRALIEEYRKKQSKVIQVLQSKEEEIKQLTNEVTKLMDTIEQSKLKVTSLSLQLAKVASEKEASVDNLALVTAEVNKHRTSHEKDIKAIRSLTEEKKKLESDKKTYIQNIQSLQECLDKTIMEFKSFVKSLADMLVNAFKEEQLKRGESQFVHNPETDALAGRVREIAHRALNMSYLELDEFFESKSTSSQLSEMELKKHNTFQTLVDKKMSSKLKVPFQELVKEFKIYITNCIGDLEQ